MPNAKRTARITARYRERERALLEAAARAAGLHLSELVRDATLERARRELARLARAEDSS